MFEGDIKLDEKGNTVIENGDLVLTTDNISFMQNIFLSCPGAWKFHPNLGFDIASYLGQLRNEDIPQIIQQDIKNYFSQYGIETQTDIFEIEVGIFNIFVNFIFPLEESDVLYMKLNSIASEVSIEKIDNKEKTSVEKNTRLNRYQKRII